MNIVSFDFRRPLLALAAWLIAMSGAVLAPAVLAEDLAATRAVFLDGVRGDKAAVKTASERFEAMHRGEPGNVLLRAYWGSCLTLQGREAYMPWTKMRLVEDGLTQLDKALALVTPERDAERFEGTSVGMEARLVAGTTFLQLPSLFNRFDAGKRVVAEAMKNPEFSRIPPAMQANFHFQWAKVAQREGKRDEEIASLRQSLSANPKGYEADAARARLKELGA